MEDRVYLCIDLKSFYASVESVERGLDPFTTNLVVADPSRGDGAICLAITPAMKALGIKNRCRIFEIPKSVAYVTALPRMKLYMQYSAKIYGVYLRYISPEDIHIYSVDECFFDVTSYVSLYEKSPKEITKMLTDAVFEETGICATAGIGTNMFLAKVALDVTAKHSPDHIGYLDEETFKAQLWHHKPITDIWNVGRGIAARLKKHGIEDMYGVAHADEKMLYREFGVNAEYLIDHSKGIEPCTIAEIHGYESKSNSLSNSQILFEDYNFDDALLVVKEMVDLMCLDLAEKNLVTDSISLRVGYSKDTVPPSGGTRKLNSFTDSPSKLMKAFIDYYEEKVRKNAPIRKIEIGMGHLVTQDYIETDLFEDFVTDEKERKKQEAIIEIRNRFGKNAILKGMNLQGKATTRKRNKLIGGHNGE